MKNQETKLATNTSTEKVGHTPVPWKQDFPNSVENNKRVVSTYHHVGEFKTTKLVCVCDNELDAKLIVTAVNEYGKLKADNAKMFEIIKRQLAYKNKEAWIMCELADTMASMEENATTELSDKLMREEMEIAISQAEKH